MATLVVTGVTGRNTVGYIVTSVLLVLLVSLVGGFRSREMDWERRGFGFSDALRLDVILGGSLLLGVIMLLGLGTPPDPRNMLTTWLWHDVKLPAGLATLDTNEGLGSGVDRSRVAGLGPGQNLDLGHSLERGASQNVALTIQVKNMPSNLIPYWRGRIFEEYTGRGWTTGPIRRVTSGPFTLVEDTPDLIIQQITDSHTGSLPRYGLPDIVATKEGAVVEQTSLGDTVGWVGTAKTYTTYSHIPGPPSPNPPEEVERQRVLMPYRVVPDELPQRVIDLTNQLTNDGQTQTDKAQAIETYLRGLKYSYEVAPLPPDGDGVDQFLFSMRQGYCTYYASAMAIMARVAGIPSRVAVGYATGTYDAARGEYIVREQDAHAWPELYIAGQGWTRWEPTPIRPIPPRVTEPVPGLPPDVALEPTPQTATHLGWWPVLWAAVAILLIVAFRRLRLGAPASAASVHAELYRMGRSLGVMPTAGDTLEEYVGRIARVVPPARQPLVRVALLLTARLYRKTPLTPGEEHSLIYTWQTARDIVGEQRSSGAPLRNDRG